MKLYPPHINGTIPAFSGDTITIPFIMNKTVNANSVHGFKLLFKTAHSNKLIDNLTIVKEEGKALPWNFDLGEVYFKILPGSIIANKIKIGNYYKVQLAYIYKDGATIGYYSSVGVIKYTSQPKVEIDELSNTLINTHRTNYIGTYSQNDGDVSEKVYNYRFDVYDNNGQLYETSGNLLHNSFEDDNIYSSRDLYTPKKTLEINKVYHIKYTVITTNGLEVSSVRYRIMEKDSINPEIKADVVATLNADNGYINISLVGEKDENGLEYSTTGSFEIKRGCSKDNYSEWNSVLKFKLNGQTPSRWIWKDHTIESGYSYKYALQQYNDNDLYSNRLESNEVYAYFEDAFLYDGERQLKIKYNPKISSFKTTLLQSKIDTIGSQYPFIFKNGRVAYKEFPLSGLISYHMDDQALFMDKEKLLVDIPITQPTYANIASEKIFKREVLDWLNDGKAKLFRSPTEGSFIVRLINVSLSPNDTLGRMLHTFSCTAYEVDEYNYLNLLNQGFIKTDDIINYSTRWETVDLTNKETGENLLQSPLISSLSITNVDPGTNFTLTDKKDQSYNITVGVTGQYNLDLGLQLEIKSVILNNQTTSGEITYSYQSSASNVFDSIQNINIDDTPIRQFMGETDIIKTITNIKTDLVDFNFLHFQKRNVYNVYKIKGDQSYYYWDQQCLSGINSNYEYEPSYIYKVNFVEKNEILKKYFLTDEYYYADGNPNNTIENYSNAFEINGSIIDLTETENYLIKKPPEDIKTFSIGSGLTLECSYRTKIKYYNVEETNKTVETAKEKYEEALKNYRELLFADLGDNSLYNEKNYILELKNAYEELYFMTEYKIVNSQQVACNKEDYYLWTIEQAIKEVNL